MKKLIKIFIQIMMVSAFITTHSWGVSLVTTKSKQHWVWEFKTIEDAQPNCPSVNNLIYTAQTSDTGNINWNNFSSLEYANARPANIGPNQSSGIVANAQFNLTPLNNDLVYGYELIDDNFNMLVTCYFKYPSADGGNAVVTMVWQNNTRKVK